ncbi:unnamed protein product [Diatraea saccharalis]|uniref:Protein kinase domain-containing protein n=1 Tax=Diatraea saccharalis TaxID=40085 RepID=A0A9N9QVG1_9NEOP|nr:unnamed protein product [Diatraea saccharalis]
MGNQKKKTPQKYLVLVWHILNSKEQPKSDKTNNPVRPSTPTGMADLTFDATRRKARDPNLNFSCGTEYPLPFIVIENNPEHDLFVRGHSRWISVYHDGRETSRAAAALLLTLLRHGLRYRQLRIRQLSLSGLCGLRIQHEENFEEDHINQEQEVVLAPSIAWNETAPDECISETDSGAEPLQVVGAGAAPVSLNRLPWNQNLYSDTIRTVRIADVSTLRNFAPSILEVFSSFLPEINDIRNVLEWLKYQQDDLEESACSWALNNSGVFNTWLQIRRVRVYEVAVFLCDDDQDSTIYESVLTEIYGIHKERYRHINSKYKICTVPRYLYVNCSDEYSLMKMFLERAQSVYWPRLIGVVARGVGLSAAANVASSLDTALVLYDTPHDILPYVHTASGRLQDLSLAFQYFLTSCQWTRLGIISENTKFAVAFVTSLNTVNNLIIRDVSIDSGVETALRILNKENARIIFINANSDIALSILCEANELRMLTDTSYVWILREWHYKDMKCANSTLRGNEFLHFTINFWWRGGDRTSLSLDSNQTAVQEKLEKLWSAPTWPLRAAPLVDAMTMLIHGFYNLVQSRPHSHDDLHSKETHRALWASYDLNPPLGVMQKLNLHQQAVNHPYVYVYKWQGQLSAVWQIYNGRVHVIYQPRPFFDSSSPTDGHSSCLTQTNNIEFAPHCHDIAWFIAIGAVVIAIPATILARRARHEQIARRDRVLTARLLARGRRASAALAAHLVDRATLQLGRELGTGRFGRVFLAVLRPPGKPPLVVAAKALREEATKAEEREFLNEAVTLASLRNNHVVRLIGVCATGGPPLVLMEHAFFGDLLKYLQERRHLVDRVGEASAKTEQVSARVLTRFAHQAALALEYLRQQRFVHRDVRASNCLVDARRSLKLADFGLARKTESGATGGEEEYSCRRRGLFPVLWMAPESLERGVFTAASDIWALGVLLLELTTLGARPYGCWAPERVMRFVCAGGYPPLPEGITPDL